MPFISKYYRIMYRTKDGSYRAGAKQYHSMCEVRRAFRAGAEKPDPKIKHLAVYVIYDRGA